MENAEKQFIESVENRGSSMNQTDIEQPIDNEIKKTTTVDTVHNDEAIKVFANYHGEAEWTIKEEKRLLRKIDFRLMIILFCTYGLQYYDKAMLGQAVSVFIGILITVCGLINSLRHFSGF